MYFTEWLKQQRYRRDFVGELAEQLAVTDWPESSDLKALRVRLTLAKATPLAIKTLYQAFEEWQVSKHLPALTSIPTGPLTLN